MHSQASMDKQQTCKDIYEFNNNNNNNNSCYIKKPDGKEEEEVFEPPLNGEGSHKEMSIHQDTEHTSHDESPPTSLNKLLNVSRRDSGIVCHVPYCCSYCATPEIIPFHNVFCTPDDMLTTPTCKKHLLMNSGPTPSPTLESSLKYLVDLGDDCKNCTIESVSDIDIFNLVYKNILEVIVIQQSEDIIAHLSKMELYSDGAKTPRCIPTKSAAEESCPGAPMKTKRPPRKIDKDICKKIEF